MKKKNYTAFDFEIWSKENDEPTFGRVMVYMAILAVLLILTGFAN